MTDRKQHGGPRPNSGGKRTGSGRKPKPRPTGIRPWVPVHSEAEAEAIKALPPDERRTALLTFAATPPAPAPDAAPTEEFQP